jgi:hypothetical protein
MKRIAREAFLAALEALRENGPAIFLVAGLAYYLTGSPRALFAGALAMAFFATASAIIAAWWELTWYHQMRDFVRRER